MKTVFLILAVIIGAVLALALLANSFPSIPNDLQRVSTLLTALQSNDEQIQIAVFGNSVSMGGVDARQLGKPAYNLSTTGQSLAETRLMMQELPSTVETVFLILVPPLLEEDRIFSKDVFNAYWMYGLRPTEESRKELERILPKQAAEMLAMNTLEHLFHSRWNIVQGINRGVRMFLRKDLDLERATNDLYFPATYTKQIAPKKMQAQVNNYIASIKDDSFALAPKQEALLRSISKTARQKKRKLIVAIPPFHPSILAHLGEKYLSSVRQQLGRIMSEEEQTFLDGTGLFFEERFFIDHVHFGNEGAKLFTQMLNEAIGVR